MHFRLERPRRLVFAGPIGRIAVSVQAEGGHYTLITLETDQVAESEADKLDWRGFLAREVFALAVARLRCYLEA